MGSLLGAGLQPHSLGPQTISRGREGGWSGEFCLIALLEWVRVAVMCGEGSTVLVANGLLFLPRCTCFQQPFLIANADRRYF